MADVRALLRAEQASRRITDPCAVYSSSGQLSCSICRTTVKSDRWDSHLQSLQHTETQQLLPTSSVNASGGSKKRKADEASNDEGLAVKKVKNTDQALPSEESEPDGSSGHPILPSTSQTEPDGSANLGSSDAVDETVDEDEWAAFEKDVAAAEQQVEPISALAAPASVQAPPVSAVELEIQTQDQRQQTDRERRQAELDAEQEDAKTQLADEFEEMEALEQRVRKLRQQREVLRCANKTGKGLGAAEYILRPLAVVTGSISADANRQDVAKSMGDEEEDDSDEDVNIWHFTRP